MFCPDYEHETDDVFEQPRMIGLSTDAESQKANPIQGKEATAVLDSHSKDKEPHGSQPREPYTYGLKDSEVLTKYVNDIKKQKHEELRLSVTQEQFARIEQIFVMGELFVVEQFKLSKGVASAIRKECPVDPEISATEKGFSMLRQTKRRELAADIRASEGMEAWRKQKDELYDFHGNALLSIGADKVMRLIAREETKEVMRRVLL